MHDSKAVLPTESPIGETRCATPVWAKPTRYAAAVPLLMAAVVLLYLLRPIWPVIVAAFLFTFLFDLPVRSLSRRTRLSYAQATALVYGIAFAVLAVLFFGSLSGIFATLQQFTAALKKCSLASRQRSRAGRQRFFSTIRVLGRYVLSKIAGREPFPDQEPPPVDRVGFFGQLYLHENH